MKRILFCAAVLVAGFGCSRQTAQQASTLPAGGDPGNAPVSATAQPVTPNGSVPDAQSVPVPSPASADATEPRAGVPLPPSAPPPVSQVEQRTAPQESVIIPTGTRVRVRLAETLDTKHCRAGERFHADLDRPIVVGGRVIVPKGTEFQGHVVEAKPSGRLKGRALLAVTLDSFRMNGTQYPIHTAADLRASKNHRTRNLAFIGGGSGGGAAIGAVAGGGVGALIGAGAGAAAGTTTALITGRRQVTLPVETPLVFTLHNSVRVGG